MINTQPAGISSRFLLIVAHGSRREASNAEVRLLGERVGALATSRTMGVEVAFLELAQPSILEGLDRCVAAGAREIIVFPYFLAAGTHVATDIPEMLVDFRQRHPEVELRLTRHLGASSSLPATILDVVVQAEAVA
jgi:sirohydrochlorin ferrochelatase